jgi:4-amino-4-deoxy-L-arabinose transferase-like glycosyltransferase
MSEVRQPVAAVTRRRYAWHLAALLLLAALVRGLFPTADPPWRSTVGVVWHDEGAWTHNARNRALYGSWVQDAWNPLYIAPVFTGLEYASFAAFGVGLWQARLVSMVAGFASVVLLALGVRRIAGREAGLIAAALLGTSHVYVMYNRAALMEGPMAAFMVGAWYAYVRSETRPAWAWLTAACVFLAFFTKAAAAFFVVAVGIDALLSVILARWPRRSATAVLPSTPHDAADGLDPKAERACGVATLVALVVCGIAALALFVIPNWREYQFYNWQISVTRKPSYDLKALMDRVTWFPIVHDFFTRTWAVLLLAMAAVPALLARAPLRPSERLLLSWVGLGALELILHDVGNERRFVFFMPPLVALAAILLGRERRLAPPALSSVPRGVVLAALPVVAYALYVAAGSLARLVAIYEPRPGVRLAALVAVLLTAVVWLTWPRLPARLSRDRWSPSAGLALGALIAAGQLVQFAQWAADRTYKNVEASRMLGKVLPPGTLVHGKLANGLALDNQIRPIFVGRGFGNYEDRKRRDDVRYILTYVAPRVGYEGPVIEDVLEAYPNRSIVLTFDVAETTTGHDRAALIDKFGGPPLLRLEAAPAAPAAGGSLRQAEGRPD